MNKLFQRRLSIKEQTLFAKRLAFLISAGVSVMESLHLLRKQVKSKRKIAIFDQVVSDIANGKFLAASLERSTYIFNEFAINIIRIGESSGTLSQNLSYLADELKKRHDLQRKVVGALIYPIFITITTLLVSSLLTVFIFPKIMPIFTSLNVDLPLSTKILLWVSDFLRNFWFWLILSIVVISTVFVVAIKKVPKFHYFVDLVLLKTPLLGAMMRSYNMTNFCRTFGISLKSGIRITEATKITAATTENLVYRKAINEMSDFITRGERISKRLEQSPKLFPDISTQLITIGEKTGDLSGTLIYLSEFHENELDDSTKNLSNSIEPVLMVFMGLLVGFIAVSVITPIYEITQNIKPR